MILCVFINSSNICAVCRNRRIVKIVELHLNTQPRDTANKHEQNLANANNEPVAIAVVSVATAMNDIPVTTTVNEEPVAIAVDEIPLAIAVNEEPVEIAVNDNVNQVQEPHCEQEGNTTAREAVVDRRTVSMHRPVRGRIARAQETQAILNRRASRAAKKIDRFCFRRYFCIMCNRKITVNFSSLIGDDESNNFLCSAQCAIFAEFAKD